MIYKISLYLTFLLLKNGIISERKTEMYEYGFQITIANIVNFVIAFLIGIIFRLVTEVALFYCVFVSLRFFCGGYHADSYRTCFVLFAITNILCLNAARLLSGFWNTVTILFLISALWLLWSIWKRAPVEHSNRPLSHEERILFKKRAVQIYCFWTGIGISLLFFHSVQLAANLISTFIAISVSF